jgi:hypothetical protein
MKVAASIQLPGGREAARSRIGRSTSSRFLGRNVS